MTEILPQNIVEAYTVAAKAAETTPEKELQAYDKVIAFCENNRQCSVEDSLKRNMLLFWAYEHVAEAKIAEKKYQEALSVWKNAAQFLRTPRVRIKVGLRMLEVVDKGHFSIPEKAREIVEITGYLQKAYRDAGDEDGWQRMERMRKTVSYLLGGSKLKH